MKNKFFQILFGVLLAASFSVLALNLIQKQNKPYSFRSFIVNTNDSVVILSNIDRVFGKDISSEQLGITNIPLKNGYEAIRVNRERTYNDVLGVQVMITFNAQNFTIVFNKSNIKIADILTILEEDFGLATASNDQKLTIEDGAYNYKFFNDYLVISNTDISWKKDTLGVLRFGNADFLKIKSNSVENHLVQEGIDYNSFKINDEIKGGTVAYKDMFDIIPSNFEHLSIYGSARWVNDEAYFFKDKSNDYFNWCESYISLLQKDSSYVIVTPIGLERDLKLILEEETLNNLKDSAQIQRFNLGSLEIMEISPEKSWSEIFPRCQDQMRYFTELGNYHILSNSKDGLNWILSAWQLGNVAAKNPGIKNLIKHYLPNRMNFISLNNEGPTWNIKGKTKVKDRVLVTNLKVDSKLKDSDDVNNQFEKQLDFAPKGILHAVNGSKEYCIVYGVNKISIYNTDGSFLFTKAWSNEIVKVEPLYKNQNKGLTIVVYTAKSIDRFTIENKGFYGLPKVFNERCFGGKAIVYSDNKQLRYFVGVGNSVYCYRQGDGLSKVDGWLFPPMSSPLNKMMYREIEGKDYIVIQNKLNEFSVLNRRGELRFPKTNKIINAIIDDKIYGSNENSIHLQYYRDGYLFRYYVKNNNIDSTVLDEQTKAISQGWTATEGRNKFWQESSSQLVNYDQYGFVESKIIKPSPSSNFVWYENASNTYIFADNKNYKLYLLDERGTMKTNTPLLGSSLLLVKGNTLYTSAENKLITYVLKE